MRPLSALPEPDFKLFKLSSKIDFIRYFSFVNKSIDLHLPKSHIEYKPLRANGHDGMLMTIHDPDYYDLIIVDRELPDATIDAIEVSCDYTPKGKGLPLTERHERIEEMRQWVISHLLPWQGEGIQAATRVSRGRGHSAHVFKGVIRRRARTEETMYYGHSNSMYADRTKPNFASMRLYKKVTDNNGSLLPPKHSCRLELTLTQLGCNHFGLTSPESIFNFEFREFGQYFRFVNPEIKQPIFSKNVRDRHHRIVKHLEKEMMREAEETLLRVGSHAASHVELLNVDRHHRHTEGNRRILHSLDDLSRRVKKHLQFVREWGSF